MAEETPATAAEQVPEAVAAPEVPVAEVVLAPSYDEVKAAIKHYEDLLGDVIREPKAYPLDAIGSITESLAILEDMLSGMNFIQEQEEKTPGLFDKITEAAAGLGDVITENAPARSENTFEKWGLNRYL